MRKSYSPNSVVFRGLMTTKDVKNIVISSNFIMVQFDFRTLPMTIFTILYNSPVAKGRAINPNV